MPSTVLCRPTGRYGRCLADVPCDVPCRAAEVGGVEQLSIKAGDELLARVLLHHVLGAVVTQHDDGSAPSMYDLDVAYPDGRRAAAEVVSTRDAQAMSLAAATPDLGWS